MYDRPWSAQTTHDKATPWEPPRLLITATDRARRAPCFAQFGVPRFSATTELSALPRDRVLVNPYLVYHALSPAPVLRLFTAPREEPASTYAFQMWLLVDPTFVASVTADPVPRDGMSRVAIVGGWSNDASERLETIALAIARIAEAVGTRVARALALFQVQRRKERRSAKMTLHPPPDRPAPRPPNVATLPATPHAPPQRVVGAATGPVPEGVLQLAA